MRTDKYSTFLDLPLLTLKLKEEGHKPKMWQTLNIWNGLQITIIKEMEVTFLKLPETEFFQQPE
jgi:hypothetical protein